MKKSWRIMLNGSGASLVDDHDRELQGNIEFDISLPRDHAGPSRDEMTITVDNRPGLGTHVHIAMRCGQRAKKRGNTCDTWTYGEYLAAEPGENVTLLCYVQGCQDWREDRITIFAQDHDGGYYLRGMKCGFREARQLVPGTKIKVTGNKYVDQLGNTWIADGSFQILDGSWIPKPASITHWIENDEILEHQYKKIRMKGLKVVSAEFFADEDVYYFQLQQANQCCEAAVIGYMVGTHSDAYNAAGLLQAGDVVDVEAFLYGKTGYEKLLFMVTDISGDCVDHMAFLSARPGEWVTLACYVQSCQSWWDKTITVYAQSSCGACFLHNMRCTEEAAAKLIPGTKIKATGYKDVYADKMEIRDGEIEILEGFWPTDPMDTAQ